MHSRRPPNGSTRGSCWPPIGLAEALSTWIDRGQYSGWTLRKILCQDPLYVGMVSRHLKGRIGDAAAIICEHTNS
jgi:hypothetical protein